MKTKFIFFFFVGFIFSCNNEKRNSKEVGERIEKIVKKMRSADPLPAPFVKIVYVREHPDTMKWIRYVYDTGRNEGNKRDTTEMYIDILKNGDSFERIYFDEKHRKEFHGDYGMDYFYGINKNGEIIKGWNQDGSTDGYKVISWRKDVSPAGDSIPDKIELAHPQIIEINLSPDSTEAIKKPDEQTLAKYNSRLKTTLDELEKMLSIK